MISRSSQFPPFSSPPFHGPVFSLFGCPTCPLPMFPDSLIFPLPYSPFPSLPPSTHPSLHSPSQFRIFLNPKKSQFVPLQGRAAALAGSAACAEGSLKTHRGGDVRIRVANAGMDRGRRGWHLWEGWSPLGQDLARHRRRQRYRRALGNFRRRAKETGKVSTSFTSPPPGGAPAPAHALVQSSSAPAAHSQAVIILQL